MNTIQVMPYPVGGGVGGLDPAEKRAANHAEQENRDADERHGCASPLAENEIEVALLALRRRRARGMKPLDGELDPVHERLSHVR